MCKWQSHENRTPATKWQWNLFYSKVIVTSVNTFIPLGDETINSSLVETGRSLVNPQSHPLLHFLVRMKPTSTNVFLQVAKNVEVTRGKIWSVRRMLKCFPAKYLKLIPHKIGSMGTGLIMQKDDSVRRGMLSSGIVPLHDNVRPHAAAAAKRLLKRFRWEVFDHPQSSARTWLPVNFISFLVRNGHRRTTFWHNELQTSVENWPKAQAAGFYDKGIGKLVPRYEKCLLRSVGYAEK